MKTFTGSEKKTNLLEKFIDKLCISQPLLSLFAESNVNVKICFVLRNILFEFFPRFLIIFTSVKATSRDLSNPKFSALEPKSFQV